MFAVHPPVFIHFQTVIVYAAPSGGEFINEIAIIIVMIAEMTIDPAPIKPIVLRDRKLPKNTIRKKPKSGSAGIS